MEDKFPVSTEPFDLATQWWPFRMAVAWVLTRDRKATAQMSFSRSVKGVESMLAIRRLSHPLERYFNSAEEALRTLFVAMSDGSVATEGSRFVGRELATTKRQRSKILPAEINSLQYELLSGEDFFISFDRRDASELDRRLQGYRDVHVFRDDLIEAFPFGRRPSRIVDRSQLTKRRDQSRGPKPGTVDRYGEADRSLFPEIERIMSESHKSAHAATLELASAGRVKGVGTAESRAKRLANCFREWRKAESR